jgi:predicted PurR-regulated permease PerM
MDLSKRDRPGHKVEAPGKPGGAVPAPPADPGNGWETVDRDRTPQGAEPAAHAKPRGPHVNSFLEKHPYACGYAFLGLLALLVLLTQLRGFALSFLFLYLVSDVLTNDARRFLRFVPKALLFSILYVAVVTLITVTAYKVVPDVVKELPGYVEGVQKGVIHYFETMNARYDLSEYINPQEVRGAIVKGTTEIIRFLMTKFQRLYQTFIYFILALVINLLLYHDKKKIDAVFYRRPDALLGFLYEFTTTRLQIFYYYFKMVMGGQIIIAAINASITAVAIFALELPRPVGLLFLVFFLGLLPIVGNLISNSILTVVALVSAGPLGAGICLGLLVGIHKLEYFLNSRIIGEIVQLPMVVTLTAFILCEVVLGAVGMMLAIPLVLYLRHDLENIPGHPEFFQHVTRPFRSRKE